MNMGQWKGDRACGLGMDHDRVPIVAIIILDGMLFNDEKTILK